MTDEKKTSKPGAAKTMAYLKMPGQTLTDLKAEWDELTEADKDDLIASARAAGVVA